MVNNLWPQTLLIWGDPLLILDLGLNSTNPPTAGLSPTLITHLAKNNSKYPGLVRRLHHQHVSVAEAFSNHIPTAFPI